MTRTVLVLAVVLSAPLTGCALRGGPTTIVDRKDLVTYLNGFARTLDTVREGDNCYGLILWNDEQIDRVPLRFERCEKAATWLSGAAAGRAQPPKPEESKPKDQKPPQE